MNKALHHSPFSVIINVDTQVNVYSCVDNKCKVKKEEKKPDKDILIRQILEEFMA